ncbi:YihY family inner membrane protein [Denitromonas iodatirespirans]|uniref:YihY family inner membrane protein n=1 Tax=Denitromonas iodatirespirans TaxID=2795389 RepID=UPI001E60F9E2|nr:YihY family inner membrane protein [Denitromonas iodatirespirans]
MPKLFIHLRDFARLLAQRFVDTRCPQVAGSLTFTTLLALVPLLTVTIAVFSNFPGFAHFGEILREFLLQNLLPEKAGQIVATYALQFSQKAANLTLIGTALLIVTALMLMLTIDGVLNTIWGVRKARPLLARISIYWVVLTLGPIFLGASLAATSYLISTSLGFVNDPPWLRIIVFRTLPVLLLGLLFGFLYFSIPNTRVNAWHALIGGFAAAIAFVLMQRALGLYLARFPSYTLIYGTFATLPIFLLWMYASWVVILLGAILAATFPAYASSVRTLPDFPGATAYSALLMLDRLADAQRRGQTVDADTLFRAARQPSAVGENLLELMQEFGWITRSNEDAWLLVRRAEDITLSDVVRRFALCPCDARPLADSELARRIDARIAHLLATGDVPITALLDDEASAHSG